MTAAPAPATTETAVLVVTVIGDPAPQGSKRHVGGGRMVESSKALGPWRDNVAWRVREAMAEQGWTCLATGPVEVTMSFRLRRPKSAPKSRLYPDGRPDADKLARAVFDALVTAGAIGDDGQVVQFDVWKTYATEDAPVGVTIGVAELRGARPDDEEQR